MPRILSLLLALTLGPALVIALPPSIACEQACPDDGPGGRCPSTCLTCTCCQHVPSLVTARAVRAGAEAPAHRAPSMPPSLPSAPDPDEILHVPEPALA